MNSQTMNNGFVMVVKRSLFFYTCVFPDTKNYLFKDAFAACGIPYAQIKKEYRKEDCSCILLECKIRKKYIKNLLSAVEKIKQRALLSGCTDYSDICKKFADLFTV